MAWGKKEFKYDIVENCGTLAESDKNNWGILLTRISWNGKPPVYDIRHYDLSTLDSDKIVMGKGVSLGDEEAMDRVAHRLVELGFGQTETLEDILDDREIYKKKKKDKIRKIKVRRL